MSVLGFDFGLQRTGVAVANKQTGIATPLCTLSSINGQPDWSRISQLVAEWRPYTLIVGMPYHLDGTKNEMTTRVEKFCRQLAGRYQLPVETISEQLTSLEAEQRLKELRQAGCKKIIRKHEIDQLAAAIILESWVIKNATISG